MRDFVGKIAVITGGGSGMGRELAKQLVSAGAHVAICDVYDDTLAEARTECRDLAARGIHVSAHHCDVTDETQYARFRDEVTREHQTRHIDLLFNNAGIGGGASFLVEERARWERTFNVSWLGVYYGARTFMPLLLQSADAIIVNTSSLHGFFALEPGGGPQSAYSSAKFAIKGFSESLIGDLRLHAPHVHVALVMPGHIGTSIVENTLRSHNQEPLGQAQIEALRERMRVPGRADPTDAEIRELLQRRIAAFREHAPITAAQAASTILAGLLAGRWRILIGDDAIALDALVREHPEGIYAPEFAPRIHALFPAIGRASVPGQSSREPEPAA